MIKPQGYDQAAAITGDFQALPAGGYICKILKAEEVTSQTGRPMLVLLFDIAEGEYKDFFRAQYDRIKDSNPDAKWGGVYRQLTDGKSIGFFKGMVTSIEVSNTGYKWNWDEKTLTGKLFGGVFGREQYESYNGDLKWSTKCQNIRSVEAIKKGVEIPEDKLLRGAGNQYYATPTATFEEVEDNGDLPF